MDVLVAALDPDLHRFMSRALAILGHRPRREAALRAPEALLVDIGPGVAVILLRDGRRHILPKPFELAELRAALAPM